MRTVVRGAIAGTMLFLAFPALSGAQRTRATQMTQPAPPPALSPEAAAALEGLEPRFASEIGLTQGWFRDRTVLYYDLGAVPAGATAGRVLWPIHGFDASGNPVAIRGQRPIFSSVPGLEGYTGAWRLSYVVAADNVHPNVLRDLASVQALVRRGRAGIRDTDVIYNLPIVPRGTRLARDTSTGMQGWYEGREVRFFDFGAVSVAPTAMWRIARGADASGEPLVLEEQNSIVDSIPVAPGYPDFRQIHFVYVDSAYIPNSLKSAAAFRAANLGVGGATGTRNLPIAILDGTPVVRAPSPVRAFADLRSPFPPAPTLTLTP